MTRLPRLSGKELLRVLEKEGFLVKRTKGSHHILKHNDGRQTVIPIHSKEIIGPGLLSKILRDIEITKEDFINLLSH
ncbi:type II toxin-antitoxin system HicA family toxin [Bacteroidota bacterium]